MEALLAIFIINEIGVVACTFGKGIEAGVKWSPLRGRVSKLRMRQDLTVKGTYLLLGILLQGFEKAFVLVVAVD